MVIIINTRARTVLLFLSHTKSTELTDFPILWRYRWNYYVASRVEPTEKYPMLSQTLRQQTVPLRQVGRGA